MLLVILAYPTAALSAIQGLQTTLFASSRTSPNIVPGTRSGTKGRSATSQCVFQTHCDAQTDEWDDGEDESVGMMRGEEMQRNGGISSIIERVV